MPWKILLGHGILKSYVHMAIETSRSLEYMALANFNWAADLQIQTAQMAVLKKSPTLW